jgi:carbonic anhydrase/acetyltransferase-like protein (isoleucine patch superfamily)
MLYKFEDKFPDIAEEVFIAQSADIIGDVTIEEDCSIWFGAVLRGDEGCIKVRRGTNIQDNCTVHITDAEYPTEIGEFVTLGHGAIVHGCRIGNYCLIGMGSIVLDGAEIGDYSILGAGSMVTGDKKIPSGVLALGSPAKVIRELTEDEKKNLEKSAQYYIELSKKHK